MVGVIPIDVAAKLGNETRMNNRNAIPKLKNRLSDAGLFIFTLIFYITSWKIV